MQVIPISISRLVEISWKVDYETSIFFLYLLIVSFTLQACNRATFQDYGTARVIPQTVEVTRVISQTVIATQVIEITPATITEVADYSVKTQQPGIDPTYYDGIIVITQYYTFLGHGLFEDAYQLLSSAGRSHSSDVDEYIKMAKLNFKTVKIITIQPYYLLAQEHCSQAKPETGDVRRFYVQIIAEGEGSLSGSALNGALQTLFLSLIQEDGEWKIDTFATIEKCP